MGHLYDTRKNAIVHKVAKDDTLATIAAKYKDDSDVPDELDWQEIALYNWATTDKAEVLRALFERVGSGAVKALVEGGEPESLMLDPAFGPTDPAPTILVPKLWKKAGLDVNKLHTVTVRSRAPAPAVCITSLDKWFIPAHETCDVDYATLGSSALGDTATVTFEVHASNYGELKAWKDGLPELQPLPNVPVYTAEAKNGQIRDWYGLSRCAKGALSPDDHPLNVAFSPYTVLLRYAKGTAHGDARIELEPFWVAFGDDKKPIKESCEIKWRVHNAELTVGLLSIFDRAGKIVFAKGLSKGDLDSNVYAWDGRDSAGELVVPGEMPYRVQLQAHTDIDVADGLALAAMHTEVRLYVHDETLLNDAAPYEPLQDKTSLDFSIADVYHEDRELDADADGVLWTKLMLAEAGFHPGPVKDANVTDVFKSALHEFQRSVPKAGGSKGHYERMTVEDDDAEAKKALDKLDESRKRTWFGKPAEPGANIDLDWRPGNWKKGEVNKGDFLARLRDPTKRMIVWIDDRNWYTDGSYWLDGYYNGTPLVPPDVLKQIHDAPEDLGGGTTDGRGAFEDRDARVDKDARDIARPWIPLQVDFRLLGKGQGLDSKVDAHEGEIAEKVRAAIGPLRVDWTFDEIEKTAKVTDVKEDGNAVGGPLPELDHESNVLLSTFYHPDVTDVRLRARPEGSRTRMALRWVLDKLKTEHDRKDVTRKSAYYNAPVDYGGIRPANAAEYFKAALGHGGESLAPWTAKPDDARQSICTAVHDRVGQEEAQTFDKRIGRAGIFFHPSRIAGDGFQVRGQVRFDDKGPYACPNAGVLRARYARWPQAQTVQFRMWRKTTVRGYVPWAPWDAWATPGASGFPHAPGTGPNKWRAHYTACHVSMENELDASDTELKCTPTSLFPNADDYFAVVKGALDIKNTDPRATTMTLSDDYSWPWSGHAHFGEPEPAFTTQGFDAAFGALRGKLAGSFVTLAIRMSLALVQAIERETGRMRGHVLVQHQTTPSFHLRGYVCDRGHSFVYLHDNDTAVMDTQNCPSLHCGTQLSPAVKVLYGCVAKHYLSTMEKAPGGSGVGNKCPAGGCPEYLTRYAPRGDAHACVDWKRGTKDVVGLYTPSCGFPVGVFWNVAGDANLWAHELGHNRCHEHSADAQQKPVYSARPEHDNADNAFIVDPSVTVKEKPQNKGWDRACLMSYVSYVKDQSGQTVTYDKDRDMPCFCFKCVLRNRGWKVTPLPTPKGDLQDVKGV